MNRKCFLFIFGYLDSATDADKRGISSVCKILNFISNSCNTFSQITKNSKASINSIRCSGGRFINMVLLQLHVRVHCSLNYSTIQLSNEEICLIHTVNTHMVFLCSRIPRRENSLGTLERESWMLQRDQPLETLCSTSETE